MVKNVEVLYYPCVIYLGAAECNALVEQGEGVAHCAVRLLCNHVKGVAVYLYPFRLCNILQVAHNSLNRDAVEVVCLATAQDCREYLVLFCGGKDEDGVCRGFLKGFEECVECCRREHVHLVYDIHAVLANLGRYHHLLCEEPYVVYRVVGGGIQLVDAI